MYLGEISRNVLLSLIDAAPKSLLFNGRSSEALNRHYGVDTAVMSEIEAVWEEGRAKKAHAGKLVEGGHAISNPESAQVPVMVNGDAGGSLLDVHSCANLTPRTAHFADVENYCAEDRSRLECIRTVLVQKLDLNVDDVSLRDAAVVRWVAHLVATRAAKLSACAVAAILVQTERAKLGGGLIPEDKHIVIGVDGRCVE